MPLLGFGVYQNYNTKDSVIEALEAGYRWDRLRAVRKIVLATEYTVHNLTRVV